MILNKIKQFVDELGVTPYELHKQTGIGKTTAYALYKHSERIPDNDTIARICQVYKCKSLNLIEIKD